MSHTFKQIHLRVDDEMYKTINNIADKRGESVSEVMRQLMKKGLSETIVEDNADLISQIVRKQVDLSMKPHVERLAKISSKAGHMSATATFLNVQAMIDLVPKEQRKNVKTMYESARKKAVAYMKTNTDDWENDL